MSEYVLELSGVSKAFSGVQALNSVDFTLSRGEIHALIGENGAGKSTLIKVIAGVHQPDAGSIIIDGDSVEFADPLQAQRRGIAAIYQEPTTFPELTVAENVFMGHPILTGRFRRVDWKAMYRETSRLLEDLEVYIDPKALMRTLTVAERQLVEIAKALSLHARILIMDEPTSALTSEEASKLFRIMNRLRSSGTGIIFVSHRLNEVFEISDRITILRDGEYISTHQTCETTEQQAIQGMVGRGIGNLYVRDPVERGEEVLRVEGLTRCGEFRDVSFSVHRGEIVGLAGLVGAGRTEVANTIFGISRPDRGSILVDGRPVSIGSPRDALRCGIAYLPEDRQQYGLVLPMSITHNITLTILQETLLSFLNQEQEQSIASRYVDLLSIRASGLAQKAGQLSGGNQQKVVLAKWLATSPRVLILDEPTKGIDVQAKAAVHKLVGQLAARGLGIVMISSELPEVMGMSDQIVVMHEGVVTAQYAHGEADQERILTAAIGRVRT